MRIRSAMALALTVALGSLSAHRAVAEKKPAPQKKLPAAIGEIHRHDEAVDKLLPRDAKIEVLAGGFEWSEGPVWIPKGGYLLFSDIPNNVIVKWHPKKGTSEFLKPSGYTGTAPFTGAEPGTNGLMLDSKGRPIMCCHGDRQVVRLEKDGTRTVLAAKYKGKRLNSPNDLVFHKNGDLYFTDPPYGLPKRYEDPARELDWCGVYRLSKDGRLTLLTKEMSRPNGIAFSPDYKTLYVANSDPKAAIWKSFPVKEDGTLGKSKLLYDATKFVGKRPGLPDGMAVDVDGNIWATGPGGVHIFTPQGKLLGRISTGEKTANCTFGGPDGGTLFLTADMYLCRVPTKTRGMKKD